jgi:hypothetical protein
MASNTAAFCKTCRSCQMMKLFDNKHMGLLNNLPIPSRPWELVGIDFVGPLPISEGYDFIMVIICQLTSMVHLLLCNSNIKTIRKIQV